jgi:hypothetical protein
LTDSFRKWYYNVLFYEFLQKYEATKTMGFVAFFLACQVVIYREGGRRRAKGLNPSQRAIGSALTLKTARKDPRPAML